MIHYALLLGDVSGEPASVLSQAEAGLLGPRAVAKRRDDFLRGRMVAKQLLAAIVPGATATDFEILPDDRGVPQVERAGGEGVGLSLSISHTTGVAAAAAVELPATVGIDVERWMSNPELIIGDYFTSEEQALLEPLQGEAYVRRATAIWSAKEAVSKAVGEGLRIAATSLVVREISLQARDGWNELSIEIRVGAPLRVVAWMQERSEYVITVAAVVPQGAEEAGVPRWVDTAGAALS